jgi:uncharacterized protein YodC (DUF2158 family)
MKTTYTEQQIQAAIDAAFPMGVRGDGCDLDTTMGSSQIWREEAPNRLSIAKAFLEKLEADPYAELKKAHAEGKVIQWQGSAGWRDYIQGVQEIGEHPEYGWRIKPKPDIFESHGKTWTKHTPGDPMPCDGEAVVEIVLGDKMLGKIGKAKLCLWDEKPSLSSQIIGWRYADAPQTNPVPDQTQVVRTHAVGDVVRLKSGGPMMTIATFTPENAAICYWFNESERDSATLPTACLIKEDVQ